MTNFNLKKTVLQNGVCIHRNYYALRNVDEHPWAFVHGMGCYSAIFKHWFRWAEDLEIPVCAIDLRGHGHSAFTGGLGHTSIEDYVLDVKLMLNEIGPAYLIGHSQGALVSRLVAERDARVIRTVSITSAQEAGMLIWGNVLVKMMNVEYLAAILQRFAFKLNDGDLIDLMGDSLNEADRKEMLRQVGFISGRSAWDILRGVKIEKGLQPKGLVIGAEHDRITPARIQRKIAKKHAFQYVQLEGACHMVPLQDGVRDVAFNHIVKYLREDR